MSISRQRRRHQRRPKFEGSGLLETYNNIITESRDSNCTCTFEFISGGALLNFEGSDYRTLHRIRIIVDTLKSTSPKAGCMLCRKTLDEHRRVALAIVIAADIEAPTNALVNFACDVCAADASIAGRTALQDRVMQSYERIFGERLHVLSRHFGETTPREVQ